MPTVQADILPAQDEFIFAKPPKDCDKVFESMYSGAVRAGKSRALCYKLVKRALYPKAFEGLTRKTFTEVTRTTLRTLLEPDGNCPPVLPRGTYKHWQTKHIITLNGGGKIYYFGCDEPDTYKSLSLSGCAVDESTELDEAEYDMLLTRCSVLVSWLELYSATNPGGLSHFLYKRFRIDDPTRRPPERKVIHSTPADNIFLSDAYKNTLDHSFSGQFRERYILGQWGSFEGMCYPDWNPAIHIRDISRPEGAAYAAIDFGFTDPFVILVGIQLGNQDIHICEEFYQSNMLEQDMVAAMTDIASRYELEAIWVPSDAPNLLSAFSQAQMSARPADCGPGAVLGGIGRVQQIMAINPIRGEPRLTVHPRCENLIREIAGYEWDKKTITRERPKKQNDHACDALRYLVTALEGRVAIDIFVPGADRQRAPEPKPEPEKKQEVAQDEVARNRTRILETEGAWN